MEERPKIKPALKPIDKLLNYTGFGILLLSWVYVLIHYSTLPEVIPTHFDHNGEIDGHGNKLTLFLLPIIGTIVYFGLGSLNNYPHIFNYAVKLTAENAAQQYSAATRALRYIKTVIQFVLAFIVYKTVASTTGNVQGLGKWFLPAFLILMFSPLIIMMISGRLKKQ